MIQVMAGLWQIPAHGIMMNIRLKSFYNPGLGATICLQLPIAIYYMQYTWINGLADSGTYFIGAAGSLLGLVVVFAIPILIMHNKNTKYPFEQREVYGFAEAKIRRMQKTGK